LHHDPPRPDELAEARAAVEHHLATARAALGGLEPGGLLVGLAGTVSTLAALEHGVAVYDRARIHHVVLERAEVERWLAVLGAEESRARLARPGMVEGRADVIVGGVLVLATVMADLDRPRCLVSEDDILDGLAAGLR
jgi:exopolyphosphatase/guanosine-5'-triphosphate,3'-diphosphate pyrophosphatase